MSLAQPSAQPIVTGLKEHRTEGEVTIHALAGRLEVTVGGNTVPLGAGELLSMAPGEMHAVRAVTESGMLLTVCRV
jgi:quercetin dioxygenase-like cupin family protein